MRSVRFLLIFFLFVTNIFANEIEVQNFVERFYQTILNRHSEPSGLKNWTDDLVSGRKSGSDIAKGFIFSPEFKKRNVNNEEYIIILYKAFFNREPDNGGFNNWKNAMNNGMSQEEVLNGFLNSIEFANLCKEYGISAIEATPIDNNSFAFSIIHNYEKSIVPIKEIYYRLYGNSSWGRNIAPSELEAGYKFNLPFETSPCNKRYQIKAVFSNNKDMVKDIYLECNKTEDIWFWMFRSTIPSENIDCSITGKNKMLYDIMKDKYFWYINTPTLDYKSYTNLDKLLDDLKYKKYDRWSYITTTEENNNWYEKGKYGGMGLQMRYSNNKVYISFVYKNSPAYKVGLKRGVEILEINGNTIKEIEDNYLWGTITGEDKIGIEVKLKVKIDSKIKNINLIKNNIYVNTVLKSEILNVNNKKIGYLVFQTFIEPSREELKEVFSKFKSENIDELILDLRYNGGGQLNIAQYLASLIGGDYTIDN